MNWSNSTGIVIFFVLLAIFQACSHDHTNSDNSTLRIQVDNSPDMLNPALSRLSVSTLIESLIYLPLASWDEESNGWFPVLVEDYHPRKTGRGVEYHLIMRPEARWSDGRYVAVRDLLYSLKMGLNPFIKHQSWAAYLELITSIRMAGDTLILSMDSPYILADEFIAGITPYPAHVLDPGNILDSFSFEDLKLGQFSILEEQKLKTLAQSFNGFGSPEYWPEPVSGLFQVGSWTPGQEISMTRVDDFWLREMEKLNKFFDTNIDTMQFVVIPDPQNAVNAFTSGVIDVLNTIDGGDSDLISSFSGLVHDVSTLQLYYIAVNHRNPLLNITDVRRALNMAINREDIVHRLFHGNGQTAYGPIHPGKSYYTAFPVPYDPEQSRHIWEKAGCRDSDGDGILEYPVNGNFRELSFDIWTTRSQISQNVAALIKGYWKSIDVDIEIHSADFRSFLPDLQNKTFDLATLALRQNNLLDDPYPLWHSSQADATGKNYQALTNDSVDYVLEQLRRSILPVNQKKYYLLLQKLFAEQVPVFFLLAPDDLVGYREGVELYWSARRPGYELLRSKINR